MDHKIIKYSQRQVASPCVCFIKTCCYQSTNYLSRKNSLTKQKQDGKDKDNLKQTLKDWWWIAQMRKSTYTHNIRSRVPCHKLIKPQQQETVVLAENPQKPHWASCKCRKILPYCQTGGWDSSRRVKEGTEQDVQRLSRTDLIKWRRWMKGRKRGTKKITLEGKTNKKVHIWHSGSSIVSPVECSELGVNVQKIANVWRHSFKWGSV